MGANSGVYIPIWIFILTGIAIIACVFIFVKVVLGRKKRNPKENEEKDESIREE
jgi:NADH:ubiquinone oxidoreductase subunit 3 (subunit A)